MAYVLGVSTSFLTLNVGVLSILSSPFERHDVFKEVLKSDLDAMASPSSCRDRSNITALLYKVLYKP